MPPGYHAFPARDLETKSNAFVIFPHAKWIEYNQLCRNREWNWSASNIFKHIEAKVFYTFRYRENTFVIFVNYCIPLSQNIPKNCNTFFKALICNVHFIHIINNIILLFLLMFNENLVYYFKMIYKNIFSSLAVVISLYHYR